jgi:penicillin-binding protein 2
MEPSIFFDEVNERQGVFHRRTFLLGGLAGAGLLALSGRLMQLQLIQANRYQELSASNQFNFRLRPPPRGRILDRNNVEIASNRPEFRLLMTRDEVQDVDAALDSVSQLLPITPERRAQLKREIVNTPKYVPVVIASDLTWEEFSRINVRTPELPGVTADMGEARVYPYGGAYAHVIGYVSRISKEELDKAGPNPEPLLLHPGFRIGKQGIEKTLDLELRGKPGAQKVEVNSVGRVIKEDPAGDIKAAPGKDVILTLDSDIQNRALEVFGEESGGAVMMDVRTGDILCLMSAPSFDVNRFATGIPAAEYAALAQYERKPLLDKVLFGTYPPGSTFKTMVALAALENGYDPKTVHVCGKAWPWGGRVWHCDEAHGAQDLHGAIVTSCDIYFYQCALAVGPDKIAATARKFGLGEAFDIGIPGQRKGIIPDREYKRKAFPHDPVWHPGETPSMGIGQGYVNVNALQLCVMVSRLANGQKALLPRLVHSIGGVLQPSGAAVDGLPFDPAHLQFVRTAMASVTEGRGTAALTGQLGLGPVKMAGKTGTAQAFSYVGGHGAHGAVGEWKYRDHAWFVAFAPADDPRYAMSVLVEHGGFGASAAAPRAREIMRVALLKDPEIRKRIEQPLPLPALPADARQEGAEPEPPTLIGPAPPGSTQGIPPA